ncbi:LysR family transcriptional regulator [Winogradskya humida]|uniref:LysR family transcriptional regulator n=1 Tax=Winogradskya humida TaxID=113566 RepID=A0ABQ3ZY52_9ACTN|nr:LysR substrate-binding domain-containing protein [Actinoplanes humidus]GIE23489.1 LysR family transcriptional regulator [Actinoplanes humidus]
MSEPLPEELDLRLVRSFTVVAEHRHFGRAALVLHTTQSALSRQIRRLEQQMGVSLFDRGARGTDLTAAGEVLLSHAEALLDAAAQAVIGTRAAARPGRITIGYTTNIIVTPAAGELRRRHPGAEIKTLHLAWNQPRPALLERRVDAVLARMPLRTGGLNVTTLYREPRVLLVPDDHHLAGRWSVTLADIAGVALPRTSDPEWDAFWRIDPRPDGSPVPTGPLADHVEDKTEFVAAGHALAIVPGGEHLGRLRPGVTAVPLEGVEPASIVLATRAGEHSALVEAFCEITTDHYAGDDQHR